MHASKMNSAVLLSLLLVVVLLLVGANSEGDNEDDEHENNNYQGWEPRCDTFLAPSSVEGSGWGVYAGRFFAKDEVVDIAPLYLSMPDHTPMIKNSILDDFDYGHVRYNVDTGTYEGLASVTFGNTMFYNHLGINPNIRLMSLGGEPAEGKPDFCQVASWVANRDIEAGEELFSSYGLDDGGQLWFAERGLVQRDIRPEDSRKTGDVFDADSAKYCAKTLAGIGKPGWHKIETFERTNRKRPVTFDVQRLHPYDNPVTICKEHVSSGTVLEMAPGLIISKAYAEHSMLAPYCYFWTDLKAEQQAVMMDLYEKKEWVVQYQGPDTGWVRGDKFEGFEEIAILPVAGNIGLVMKVSPDDDPNCRLEITSSGSLTSAGGVEKSGSAGIILSLIATRTIESGEVLRLDMHESTHASALELLFNEIKLTGHPIPHHMQRRYEQHEVRTCSLLL